MLLHVEVIHSFLFVDTIQQCEYATVHLSVLQLGDMGSVEHGPLTNSAMMNVCVHIFGEQVQTGPLGLYPGVWAAGWVPVWL